MTAFFLSKTNNLNNKKMERVSGLVCSICGAVLKPSETEYICPHKHPNPGNLTVEYDMEKVRAMIEADEKNQTTWPD